MTSSAPTEGTAFGISAPGHLRYSAEFVARVEAIVGLGSPLGKRMAYNQAGVEYEWVFALLEYGWKDAQKLFLLRALYTEYQRIRRETEPTYVPIARYDREQRTWPEAEHALLCALLEADCFTTPAQYMAVWQLYQTLKEKLRLLDDTYQPIGLTPQVVRDW